MTINQIFNTVDSKDAEGFAELFAEDGMFRFGNLPPVSGKEAINKFVNGFFESIASLQHQVSEQWAFNGGNACHGQVTYTRHDQSTLTVPFSLVIKINGDGISDYLIFADTSLLYQE